MSHAHATGKLRLGRTSAAKAAAKRLEHVDKRASDKLKVVLQAIANGQESGKSIAELNQAKDERARKVGKLLAEQGFSDHARVTNVTIAGPGKGTPPSTLIVVHERTTHIPYVDLVIIAIDLLVGGQSLLFS